MSSRLYYFIITSKTLLLSLTDDADSCNNKILSNNIVDLFHYRLTVKQNQKLNNYYGPTVFNCIAFFKQRLLIDLETLNFFYKTLG